VQALGSKDENKMTMMNVCTILGALSRFEKPRRRLQSERTGV
jgi:hypothetical protein